MPAFVRVALGAIDRYRRRGDGGRTSSVVLLRARPSVGRLGMSASLELLPVAASVPEGRRFVTAFLHNRGLDALVETAALLTSELLTNCVLHARTPIRLTVTVGSNSVEVVIRDGLPVAPRQRSRGPEATTGRGLDLLDRLATSWEVTLDAAGKSIRFTLDGSADPWAAYTAPEWRDV